MTLKVNKEIICSDGESSELKEIRDFVFSHALNFGFGEKVSNDIALAVDEACTNLIRYAFLNKSGYKYCVKIETQPNQFIINITDNAKPFNPIDVKSPDMDKYMKEYRKGGLGIHLIKLIMDEILYTPSGSNGEKNLLTLKKFIHQKAN